MRNAHQMIAPPAIPRLSPPAWGRAGAGGPVALALTLLLAAPAAADTSAVVQDHARPGYDAFAKAAATLATIDGCNPDTLRPAFHAAYDAWMQVAHLHLGPAEAEGRSLAILYWPDPKGLGAKAQAALLTGTPLTPEAMAQHSVAARGLSGLERLLYPTGTLPADPCPLIQATADDLARMGDELTRDWLPFGDLLLTAGQPGNEKFLKPEEATQALFTQLATGLEFIADRQIGRPLATFDKPRPDLAQGHAAGRGMQNITLSLQALRDLTQKLNPDSPKTLAAFDRAITLARGIESIDSIADPQGWLKLEILQQAVRAARDTAVAELGPALGVELGFNSQDGD
ncbi:imelysin family protein [Tabrizicola soli]|uniref:Imelysin family protein n=1 Tax=Tabrizicola soli TaxID=2185115 RepID=A0ABV7DUD9_9RHOB|nr:imelysin family protein [Tabrizicola soli]